MEKGDSELPAGTELNGRYRIVRKVREGGMGTVYEGVHLNVDRPVAIKLLRRDLTADPKARERFQREAKAAGRVGHDNICEILDFGEASPETGSGTGELYIVMPLLQGRSLSEVVRAEGPLAVARAADIACQLLSALSAAHAMGIIHRDLKPDNVFLTDLGDRADFVKILDFGISKVMHSPTRGGKPDTITDTGAVLGTPYYMSPEQARGVREIDGRTDVYAAGVILYEMLTARRAIDGDSYNDILWRIWNDPIAPPRTHRPDLPLEIQEVVLQAVTRDPRDRYPSAEAMRRALTEAVVTVARDPRGCVETVSTMGATPPQLDLPSPSPSTTPAIDVSRRRLTPALLSVVAAGVVGLALGVGFTVALGDGETPGEPAVPTSAGTVPPVTEAREERDAAVEAAEVVELPTPDDPPVDVQTSTEPGVATTSVESGGSAGRPPRTVERRGLRTTDGVSSFGDLP